MTVNVQEAKDAATMPTLGVPFDRLVIFDKSVDTLREMLQVQCSGGNWNYDPYMHGMANGMIFALSLFDDKEPQYLEAPEVWLKDIPNNDKPTLT
jgi:hypothetical protein